MLFKDRVDAGQKLGTKLLNYKGRPDVIVLALPRGGVPVGFEVAKMLNVPLDVFLVRKLGFPGYEELAIGAIASGGVRVMNDDVLSLRYVSDDEIEKIAARERQELERRERDYRGNRPAINLTGLVIILVDDGLATGASMRAAVKATRAQKPARTVIAVPTASYEICKAFEKEVDEIVCAITPEPFHAVGLWYENFSQTTDEEVRHLLDQAALLIPNTRQANRGDL